MREISSQVLLIKSKARCVYIVFKVDKNRKRICILVVARAVQCARWSLRWRLTGPRPLALYDLSGVCQEFVNMAVSSICLQSKC